MSTPGEIRRAPSPGLCRGPGTVTAASSPRGFRNRRTTAEEQKPGRALSANGRDWRLLFSDAKRPAPTVGVPVETPDQERDMGGPEPPRDRAEAKSSGEHLTCTDVNVRGLRTALSAVVSSADELLGRSDLGRRRTPQLQVRATEDPAEAGRGRRSGSPQVRPRDSDFASACVPNSER